MGINLGYMLSIAVDVAKGSPCAKSRRGVVIFDSLGHVVGRGFNSPPCGWTCARTEECRANCRNICVHAEQAAILDAGRIVLGMQMLHIEIDDAGHPLTADKGPTCLECAKLILAAGIKTMWLYQQNEGTRGLTPYPGFDFHLQTLANLGLLTVTALRSTKRKHFEPSEAK